MNLLTVLPLFLVLLANGLNAATLVTPTSEAAITETPTPSALVAAKLPTVLKAHSISPNSTLFTIKLALANVTKFNECYEKGIVGKDVTLDIFNRNATLESSITSYFTALPNVINSANAERRISALLHSMLLVADLVIDCDQRDTKDPIGLTPLSCLPVEDQAAMVG